MEGEAFVTSLSSNLLIVASLLRVDVCEAKMAAYEECCEGRPEA